MTTNEVVIDINLNDFLLIINVGIVVNANDDPNTNNGCDLHNIDIYG